VRVGGQDTDRGFLQDGGAYFRGPIGSSNACLEGEALCRAAHLQPRYYAVTGRAYLASKESPLFLSSARGFRALHQSCVSMSSLQDPTPQRGLSLSATDSRR